MKKVFIFLFFVFVHGKIVSQIKRDTFTLKQKAEAAELIFEGRVIAKKSFWNTDSSMILTANLMIPLKWFKGDYKDTVELLTMGGVIDGRFERAEHTFQVSTDNDYFLYLRKADPGFLKVGKSIYFPTNINYGVIIINTHGGGDEELGQGKIYNDIANELYKPIAAMVGTDYKVFAKNHHEEMIEKEEMRKERGEEWSDSIRKRDANTHALEYFFKNIKFVADPSQRKAITAITFDTQLGHVLDRVDKITSLSIFFNYDTSSLGSNLVASKQFEAFLGDSFAQNYLLTYIDSAPGLIRISVSAIELDTAKLFMIESKFYDLIHCRLAAPKNKTIKLNPKFQFNQSLTRKDGNTFFDSVTNAPKAFALIYITSTGSLYFPVK